MLDVLILVAGFVFLIIGADKLVDAASSLAAKMGIPNIVIGLTIVAFGTSAPELVVNVFAALEGSTEMVLGNVLGSNIFNVLAILGVSSVIYPLSVKTNTTWLEIPLSLLAAIAVLVVANDILFDNAVADYISRTDGMILLLFFTIFLVYNLKIAQNNPADEEETKHYTYLKSGLFIALGLAGLVIGGRLIVTSAVSLAEAFGLSERVIALTVVSVGTSLPELATSIVAVRKQKVDIAIGNVVGSNIFNIFLILGVSAVVTPLQISANAFFDIAINIAAGMLLFIFIFTGKGRQLSRAEGIVFLVIYLAYVSFLVTQG
ncbi:MAG: calcium/sodium antiporter [Hymenobacteraceae bacterium]|nr:calcium/sodium antiporter [Hymenobacteraceae bacterium]